MFARRDLLAMLGAKALAAQQQTPPNPTEPPVDFICPMDRDVKQRGPGKCPRCGMKLTANLPEHVEYGFDVVTAPRLVRAGAETAFEFRILDPKTRKPVREFEVMHEKLFHLFLVSSDLEYFAHQHPVLLPDGRFQFRTTLPRPGVYRVVADCFPKGGTPQFLTRTLITAGAPESAFAERAVLAATPSKQKAANLEIELTMQPAQPLAGLETILFFTLRPREGLEQYLAAWGHMLVASDDLLDLIHDHPLYSYPEEPVRPQVQFNVLFPRPRTYRVWVQFQRLGVVNTVGFNVPVKELG
jgi:hypothetical protein